MNYFTVILVLSLKLLDQGHAADRGQTDDKLNLLDNYIPAAMQVIFYLTDAMKYEIRPQVMGPTSTTVRPTAPHRPGNYAPEKPPGPQAYYAEEPNYKPWKTPPQGLYINKKSNLQADQQYVGELLREALPEGLDVLSSAPAEILHQINALGDFDTIGDDDNDALRFALNYDDTPNLEFLRQKKIPPTRAYVTLLSLYDLLNKEAKEKNLNKYNGYEDRILNELNKTSQGTANAQLRFVLSKILEARNTRKASIVKKLKVLIEDLDSPDSYINMALNDIPPLQFSL